MNDWVFLVLVFGILLLSVLLFYFVFMLLGSGSYSEPARLKREMRESHGERVGSEEEKRNDQKDWFGSAVSIAKGRGGIIAIMTVALIVVAGFAWFAMRPSTPISQWLLPALLLLLFTAGVGFIIGGEKGKMVQRGALVLGICAVVGAVILSLPPIRSWSLGGQNCLAMSASATRSCTFSSKSWSIISEEAASTGTYHACAWPGLASGAYATKYQDQNQIWRFLTPTSVGGGRMFAVRAYRTADGSDTSETIQYRFIPIGTLCPDNP